MSKRIFGLLCLLMLASTSSFASPALYCSGYELKELTTGKFIRYLDSLTPPDFLECKKVLNSSKNGFYCHRNELKELKTGKFVRYLDKLTPPDYMECEEVLANLKD
jgi:hypothetical protein